MAIVTFSKPFLQVADARLLPITSSTELCTLITLTLHHTIVMTGSEHCRFEANTSSFVIVRLPSHEYMLALTLCWRRLKTASIVLL
jgi:hypothetical protein